MEKKGDRKGREDGPARRISSSICETRKASISIEASTLIDFESRSTAPCQSACRVNP
jgi:hypothetical protein